MPANVPVSKKRLLLAVYLDLVLFSAGWGLALHFVAPGREYRLVQYVVFAVLEALLLAVVKWSPGEYLLSIRFPRSPSDPIHPDGTAQRRLGVVDGRVWAQESLFTVVLGVYLIVDGAKSMVRWTMGTPPQPFFGLRLSPDAGAALAVTEGLIYLLLGALVLRLWAFAPLAVSIFAAFQLAALVWSWRLWDEFAREMVVRRREFQGLPVREGEVELAQRLMPEAAILLVLLQVAIVLAFRHRFAAEDNERVVEQALEADGASRRPRW